MKSRPCSDVLDMPRPRTPLSDGPEVPYDRQQGFCVPAPTPRRSFSSIPSIAVHSVNRFPLPESSYLWGHSPGTEEFFRTARPRRQSAKSIRYSFSRFKFKNRHPCSLPTHFNEQDPLAVALYQMPLAAPAVLLIHNTRTQGSSSLRMCAFDSLNFRGPLLAGRRQAAHIFLIEYVSPHP